MAFAIYRKLRMGLGPVGSLYLKNGLQRLMEVRARMVGLRLGTYEDVIPPSTKGKTVFVVAPGASLNAIDESQWEHVSCSYSVGLGGTFFHYRQLDSYLSEHPPLLAEILAGEEESEAFWLSQGLSREDLVHRLPRLRMKLVPSLIWKLSDYRKSLGELGISNLPHLRLRYLPDSDELFFGRKLARISTCSLLPGRSNRHRFPQLSSTLPSIVLTACLVECAEVVLLGVDLSEEYFSQHLSTIQRDDLSSQNLRSSDGQLHITEGGTHLEAWQTVSSQLKQIRDLYPGTQIRIGTSLGPLTSLFLPYQWP